MKRLYESILDIQTNVDNATQTAKEWIDMAGIMKEYLDEAFGEEPCVIRNSASGVDPRLVRYYRPTFITKDDKSLILREFEAFTKGLCKKLSDYRAGYRPQSIRRYSDTYTRDIVVGIRCCGRETDVCFRIYLFHNIRNDDYRVISVEVFMPHSLSDILYPYSTGIYYRDDERMDKKDRDQLQK